MSQPAPGKACGDCGLCCKLMGVRGVDKPPGKWCVHFRRASGCDIYADRPTECGVFNCTWLITEALGPEWKPTEAGFLLHTERAGQRLIVECDPSAPPRWKKPPYRDRLQVWVDAGLEVMVFTGAKGVKLDLFGVETPVTRPWA